MKPLRDIPTIPYGDFSRYEEKKSLIADREIPPQDVIETYLDFLDTLDPLHRQILAENFFAQTTGRIAEKVGFNDIEVHLIGVCGNDPYPWKDSAKVAAIENTLTALWEVFSFYSGVARLKTDQPKKYPYDQDRISRGFFRMVAEIIYGDYGNDWLTEDPYPFIVELIMDSQRLRELVTLWYEENYEARMQARNQELGSTAVTPQVVCD